MCLVIDSLIKHTTWRKDGGERMTGNDRGIRYMFYTCYDGEIRELVYMVYVLKWPTHPIFLIGLRSPCFKLASVAHILN